MTFGSSLSHAHQHKSPTDLDMTFSCRLGSDVTTAAQATHISMVPVAAWLLDINMASSEPETTGIHLVFGRNTYHGHLHRFQQF